MKIFVMAPLMVMSPSYAKPVLVLSFNFGLTGSKLLLIEIGESTDSPTLFLKRVLLIRQGEIKYMGSVGGKTPTESKLYLLFSNLRHIEQDEVDVICCVQLYHR